MMPNTAPKNHRHSALSVELIHATSGPVFAYAKQLSELRGEPFNVVSIPEGSAAYRMGYRFTSVPESELAYYLANGAELAVQLNTEPKREAA